MLIADEEDAETGPSLTSGSTNGFAMWGSNLILRDLTMYNKRFNNIYGLGLCHPTSKIFSKEISS